MFDGIDKEEFLKDSVLKAKVTAVGREVLGVINNTIIVGTLFGLVPLIGLLACRQALTYPNFFKDFCINAVIWISGVIVYEFIRGVQLRFKAIALTREVFGKAFDIVATGVLSKEQAAKLKTNKLAN